MAAQESPFPLLERLELAWLLPDELRNSDTLTALRAKLLALVCLATALICPLFALVFAYSGSALLVLPTLVAGLVMLSPLYLLKKGDVDRAGNSLATTSFLVLCGLVWLSGGARSESLVWFFYPPVVAMVFAGPRRGLFWAVASILACVGFYLLKTFGAPFPGLLDESRPLVALSGSVAIVGLNSLFFLLYTHMQRWLSDSLAQAQEAALSASRQSFRTLIENSPDGTAVLHDGELRYANPALSELVGYGQAELEGMEAARLIPSSATDELMEVGCREQVEDQPPEHVQGNLLCKDGSTVDVELHSFVAAFQGESSVIVMVRDISERKELQAKMMQMDRMIAVGTLAAGVAHEINNPLSFVSGNVALLRTEFDRECFDQWTPPEGCRLGVEDFREMMGDVAEGAERIRRIVADLRTFSRHGDDDEAEAVDVASLLESVIKMADHEIKHRARLSTEIDDLPPVRGGNSNLGQVFLNLLVNAAHAIPSGERDANEIGVRARRDGEQVVVEICDTGTGIPKEVRAHIFDPFFSTKSRSDGMGLGLYITQNIVRQQGGELTFESTLGKGTTFRVRLPISDQKPADISSPLQAVREDHHEAKVLLIDDEALVLRTLRRALSDFDVTAMEAASEALAALRAGEHFDTILCDLLMPQMSGMQFYQALADEFPGMLERVIFISGGTFTEGARDFIDKVDAPLFDKPFDLDKLRAAVLRRASRRAPEHA